MLDLVVSIDVLVFKSPVKICLKNRTLKLLLIFWKENIGVRLVVITSGVKGHTKMAPSKKKHARNQACSIPGGFTGIV